MNPLAIRRLKNCGLLLFFILVMMLLTARENIALRHSNFFSGWVLFVGIVVLSGLNFRKKLPFLNLGRANYWLQLHIYMGFFTVAVFLIHIDFKTPNGVMEALLGSLYVAVAGSGILGIWLSRSLPSRLSCRGEQVLFERIPAIRARLQKEVETLALNGITEGGSTTLATLYTGVLFQFLSRTRNFWFHCFGSNWPYHKIRDKMQGRNRYLNQQEKDIMSQIAHRVRLKNDLDYQYSGQALLKRWLFVHVPLTYILLVFTLLHIIVSYAFIGGI